LNADPSPFNNPTINPPLTRVFFCFAEPFYWSFFFSPSIPVSPSPLSDPPPSPTLRFDPGTFNSPRLFGEFLFGFFFVPPPFSPFHLGLSTCLSFLFHAIMKILYIMFWTFPSLLVRWSKFQATYQTPCPHGPEKLPPFLTHDPLFRTTQVPSTSQLLFLGWKAFPSFELF